MPHYDYVCTHCGYKQEDIFQKMSDTPLTNCPQCKRDTFQKKISAGIGVQFHGTGFYETDYGSKKQETKEKVKGNCGCGKSVCSS